MVARHLAATLLLLPAVAIAKPAAPLTADQSARLRCAAAFAFVGSEQARGAPGWEGFPDLTGRGGRFIAFVGEGLMRETGRSREDIRGELKKAIDGLQAEATAAPDPADKMHAAVRDCMGMLDRLMPVRP